MENQSEKTEIEKILDDQFEKIKPDLIARGMILSAVAALDPETANLQIIGYKPNGIIYHVSNQFPVIRFYGSNVGQATMHSLGDIYTEQAVSLYNTKKTEEEKKAERKNICAATPKRNSKLDDFKYLLSFKWTHDWLRI